MKGRFVLIVIILFILSVSTITSNDILVDPTITENLEEQETVSVVIQYKEEPQEAGILEAIFSDEIEQEVILEEYYSAKITKDEFEDLLRDSNVESVVTDGIASILLTDSIPQQNITTVYPKQYNSINFTGQGQSICVIDTGVNSTHENLYPRVIAEKCYCSVTDLGSGGCCSDNTAEDSDAEDVHSHGTHVAGIIASNHSIYRGVAFEANIVAVRVTNRTGSAEFSDIAQGIAWCTTNAATYNISVISISLGGGAYSAHCDATFAPTGITTAINNAYNANVSVVIATGNSGSITKIGSPACIENAIAVSSADKTDDVPSYADRNAITDMLAVGGEPGATITALNWAGGTTGKYGTSMAAPHVSGAIAILQQYKQIVEGRQLTADEVNNTITTNGTNIADEGSGLNFTRLDLLTSFYAVDNLAPTIVSRNTTALAHYFYNNITFLVNVTDVNLQTVILEGNWSGSLENITLTNQVGDQYNYTLNTGNFSNGDTFSWRVNALDANNNLNTSSFATINILGGPSITINSPANQTLANNATVNFNFTVTDEKDASLNCSLYLDDVLNQTNSTTLNNTATIFTNILPEGSHTWFISCNDSDLVQTNSSVRTIEVDTIAPQFIGENFTALLELGNNWTYSINITDNNLDYVNFSYNAENTTLTNTSNTFSTTFQTFINGTNNFVVYAYDLAGNVNSTSNSFVANDSVTGPRILNPIYNTTVANNSQQRVTTYLINSFPVSSAYTTFNNVHYNMTNNTAYNFTTNFTALGCGASNFTIYGNDTQGSNTRTLNFTINMCCGNSVCETGESCSSCTADCGACPTTTTTSSGGGGGGGGGSSEESTSRTLVVESASPEAPIEFSITSTVIPVGKIEIVLKTDVTNIKVKAEVLDEKPTGVVNPQGDVYKYLELSTTNLDSEYIDQAEITFHVPTSQVTDKDNIILQRYNQGWEQLPTSYVKLYQDEYYYKSTTEGFSYFVITELKGEQEVEEEIAEDMIDPVMPEANPEYAPESLGEYSISFMQPFIFSLVIIIMLSVIVIALIVRRKRKSKT